MRLLPRCAVMPACLALLGNVFWLSQRCDPFGASITALSRHACSRSPGGRQELRQCDGGFSVCVRPELALRLAQLGDDGQLLLTTATGQLLVWILECLALAPPAAAAVLPAAFKPAAGRPGDQRVLRSATADSWGRLEGRWPLEWSQELHCSCYAHSCQTALRAGGFTLDYGGSGGQQLRFKLDGRPNPQPQPLLATSTCPAWWCAAAAACSARART